ncbi:MAG: ABC transporter permease [Clostridiales Family XIII bacterium]|jgi:D-methionine transport system permease protein|nr:ABC transporter permease [Clostridiales Family XIII bacterium]
MAEIFASEAYRNMIILGIWQTLYMTIFATVLAYVVGLPLGVLMVTTGDGGITPNKVVNAIFGFIINILRSVPFLIMVILLIPLTRAVMGTTIGSTAMIFPLFIASFAFVARLVESSLQEVDNGIIEAAWAMGSSPWRIILRVLIPEARASLLLGAAIAVTTILSYSAMAGILAGGGLGDIAIRYGYYRYQKPIMFVTVILLVIIVQILQEIGERFSRKVDKRISAKRKGKKPVDSTVAKEAINTLH